MVIRSDRYIEIYIRLTSFYTVGAIKDIAAVCPVREYWYTLAQLAKYVRSLIIVNVRLE